MIKIIYAGSPDISKNTLAVLFENQKKYNFEIVGVLSNPPTAKGRHKDLIPTEVSDFAIQNNLPLFTPEHLNSEIREQIQKLNADLLVSFAYGHIFGPKFLSIFRFGGINLHPSFLPKFRGCTPVQQAIINLEKQIGVSLQTLALKMDEGDILVQEIIDLNDEKTACSVLNESSIIGAKLICSVLNEINLSNKMILGQKQTGEASYTKIITKNDTKINWQENTQTIEAKIRAFDYDGGAWCLENNLPLKILKSKKLDESLFDKNDYKDKKEGTVVSFVKNIGFLVKTVDGFLVVTELQRQSKKQMNYKDFFNGARDFVGTVLE